MRPGYLFGCTTLKPKLKFDGFLGVSAEQILKCESSGYKRNMCDAGISVDYVELYKRHSRSACEEGKSWGQNGSQGVWVDKGCRADFLINATKCESGKYKYKECDPGFPVGNVRLLKKLSRSACEPGKGYGAKEDGTLWVDKGCRGIFAITRRVEKKPEAEAQVAQLLAPTGAAMLAPPVQPPADESKALLLLGGGGFGLLLILGMIVLLMK
jgi:hypothetical protein